MKDGGFRKFTCHLTKPHAEPVMFISVGLAKQRIHSKSCEKKAGTIGLRAYASKPGFDYVKPHVKPGYL